MTLALKWMEDDEIPPYVKVKAMEFFVRLRPEAAAPADDEVPVRDRFLTLMSDMSSLDETEGLPPNAAATA